MVFIFGWINTPCTNQRGDLRSPVHTARLHDALQPLVIFDLFGLQAQMRINLRGDTLRVRFPTQTVQRQTRALAHLSGNTPTKSIGPARCSGWPARPIWSNRS